MQVAKKLHQPTGSSELIPTDVYIEIDESLKSCFGSPIIKPGKNHDTVNINAKIPKNINVDLLVAITPLKKAIDITEQSMLAKEYVKTNSHMNVMGGGHSVNIYETIAMEFYNDSNVSQVYFKFHDISIDIFLLLNKEYSGMSLDLAELQMNIEEKYDKYNIEILYSSIEHTDLIQIKQDGFQLLPKEM